MLANRWEFWLLIIAVSLGILYISNPKEVSIDFGAIKQEISDTISSVIPKDSKGTQDKPKSTSASTSKKEGNLLDKVIGLFEDDGKSTAKSLKNKKYGDFLNQPGEIEKAMKDFGSANGDSLIVYRAFVIYPTHVSFSRQDPKNEENFDKYLWHENTGWNDPKPEQTPSPEDAKKWSFDLTTFNFKMIPDLTKRALEAAKKEGLEDGKVEYMVITKRSFSGTNQDVMIQIQVKNERKSVMVRADKSGRINQVK